MAFTGPGSKFRKPDSIITFDKISNLPVPECLKKKKILFVLKYKKYKVNSSAKLLQNQIFEDLHY